VKANVLLARKVAVAAITVVEVRTISDHALLTEQKFCVFTHTLNYQSAWPLMKLATGIIL